MSTPNPLTNRPRIGSPSVGSILITAAPQSASTPPTDGPATQNPSSTTLMPSIGPGIGRSSAPESRKRRAHRLQSTVSMNELNASLPFGIAAGSANVLGGLMVVSRREPWHPRVLHGFVALGAGLMLAAALLAMAPAAARLTDFAPFLVLGGYLVVHLFEHTIAPHFHFGEETHPHLIVGSSVWASALVGLVVHSLFDCISMASGFLASPALRLL